MKKLALTLLLSFIYVISTYGAQITVDNNINAPNGVFTTLVSAVNVASPGDTILIKGSPTAYADTYVYKKLHFIGDGYLPNKENPHPTTINYLYLNNTLAGNASGSTVEGIKTFGAITLNNDLNTPLDSITVRRCQTNITFSGIGNAIFQNLVFYNNWELSLSGNSTYIFNNIILSNNLLGIISLVDNPLSSFLISNNLITNTSPNNNPDNCVYSNNIWYYTLANLSADYNSYYNNISISGNTGQTVFNTTGTNSGAFNQENVDPLFESETNQTIELQDDLNLSANSPGKNAGSDGTDIGIYGGAYPWPEGGASGSGYMYSQEADIPQVNQMQLQNAIVPQNGTLNVNVIGITNH
ncbi:hypothetical protein [Lishizhenia tianjinensis]|nr:hypothetical protein [Lishizhenia tianjinensis]